MTFWLWLSLIVVRFGLFHSTWCCQNLCSLWSIAATKLETSGCKVFKGFLKLWLSFFRAQLLFHSPTHRHFFALKYMFDKESDSPFNPYLSTLKSLVKLKGFLASCGWTSSRHSQGFFFPALLVSVFESDTSLQNKNYLAKEREALLSLVTY